jgi:hypothetical protein
MTVDQRNAMIRDASIYVDGGMTFYPEFSTGG